MKLLIIDDRQETLALHAKFAKECGHESETVQSFREIDEWSTEHLQTFDVALVDKQLQDAEDGLSLGPKLHEKAPALRLIMVSAFDTEELRLQASAAGFYYYLRKPLTRERLGSQLDEIAWFQGEIKHPKLTELGIVGRSSGIIDVAERIVNAAQFDESVLITGETGVGKELVATGIHALSSRKAKPFLPVNCASIPETLFESEAFGHETGAFTGAVARRAGFFEQANGGTVFLDEIGDMPPGQQTKLLRALQEQEVRRLGATKTTSLNFRVVAATNRKLDSKAFREDLYYRINVIPLHVPPLEERKEDIPLLAHFFLETFRTKYNVKVAHFSNDALQELSRWSWPGNVRELQNLVTRMAMRCKDATVIRSSDVIREMREVNARPHGTATLQGRVKEESGKVNMATVAQRIAEYFSKTQMTTEEFETQLTRVLGRHWAELAIDELPRTRPDLDARGISDAVAEALFRAERLEELVVYQDNEAFTPAWKNSTRNKETLRKRVYSAFQSAAKMNVKDPFWT